MRRIIQQSIVLPAPAERLFEMYLDPNDHAAFTGFPVAIGCEPGVPFRAFNDQLSGRILAVVRPRLIVQSWRSVKFNDADPDSTLVLAFTPESADLGRGRIDLIHVDVPEHDFGGVTEGWQKHYWGPWRSYLEKHST